MSNKIERLAVTEIIKMISRSDYLEPFIDLNDKTPSWDGNIFMNTDKNTKRNRKIPVQVKGRTIPKLKGTKVSVSVNVNDLKNYYEDGGAIYFVVHFEKNNTDNYKIYYNSLLPFDINEYLKRIKTNSKSISIKFSQLDCKNSDMIEDICKAFLVNKKLQSNIYTDKKELTDFKEIIMPIPNNMSNLEHYYLNNDAYIYGVERHKNQIMASVPLSKVEIENITGEIPNKIKIGDITYYNSYKIVRNKEQDIIKIGKGIFLNLDDEKINVEAKGNLKDRLKDIKFIIEAIKVKKISISDIEIEDINFKNDFADGVKEYLDNLINIKRVLDYFNIEEECLDMDSFDKKDYKNIDLLIDVILYNNKIKMDIKPGMVRLDIGNLRLLLFAYLDKNGSLVMKNLFNKEINKKYKIFFRNELNEEYDSSMYILLKANDFLECSNISYNILEKSVKSIELSDEYFGQVILLILELIKAYDINTEMKKCLDIAERLLIWLKNRNNNILVELNLFQIYKRKRELTDEEIEVLIELKNKEEECRNICGIHILLGNKSEFNYWFKKLSIEEQGAFKEYPIYKLLDKD